MKENPTPTPGDDGQDETPGTGTEIRLPASALVGLVSHLAIGAVYSVAVLKTTCDNLESAIKRLRDDDPESALAEDLSQMLAAMAAAGMASENSAKMLGTIETGICRAINATEDRETPARPITPGRLDKVWEKQNDMRRALAEWAQSEPAPLAFGAGKLSAAGKRIADLAEAEAKAQADKAAGQAEDKPAAKKDPQKLAPPPPFTKRNGDRWKADGTRDN